mmetsp:Transcript_42947/g.103939  ORF Transcript_42947/g.103939 Transcript_42947/m.103939 type:complete len:89 (-) Transcript_42947:1749-2015(-)
MIQSCDYRILEFQMTNRLQRDDHATAGRIAMWCTKMRMEINQSSEWAASSISREIRQSISCGIMLSMPSGRIPRPTSTTTMDAKLYGL